MIEQQRLTQDNERLSTLSGHSGEGISQLVTAAQRHDVHVHPQGLGGHRQGFHVGPRGTGWIR
jgi:hypothetical protein